MIKTRSKMFETNSSSSHSFTYEMSNVPEDCSLHGDGPVYLAPQSFGWEQERYSDAYTKLCYIMAGRFDGFQKRVSRLIGREVVPPEDLSDAYIDHQSSDVAKELWNMSDDQLRRWILDPCHILIIDNDNN